MSHKETGHAERRLGLLPTLTCETSGFSKSVSIANLTFNDNGKIFFQALCSHVLWILNMSRFQIADAIEPCLSVLTSVVKT